jgi:hypothetical protein
MAVERMNLQELMQHNFQVFGIYHKRHRPALFGQNSLGSNLRGNEKSHVR